jgi:hypothetical protein
MADTLESLEIEVKHSASGADAEINKLADSIRGLSASLNGVPSKLRKLVEVMNAVKGNMNVTINDNSTSQTAGTINNIQQAAQRAGKATQEASKGIKALHKEASKSKTPLDNLVSSLKRIAFYRMIRSVIKAITQALQEGLQNAYAFSQGITTEGHRFSSALDSMSSSGLKMKNQLGSAFIALLTAIAPIVNTIISLITRLADALSQFFSVFTGGTYLKAVDVPAKWADGATGAAKAAKEWKNQLLGFDEINRLEAPSDNGGGGGASAIDPSAMFVDTPIDGIFAKIRDKWLELVNELDFEPLKRAWGELEAVVSRFAEIVERRIGFVWETYLKPLAHWTIEKGLPLVIEDLAKAFGLVLDVLEDLEPFINLFEEKVVVPMMNWDLARIEEGLKALGEIIDKVNGLVNGDISFDEFFDGLGEDLLKLTGWLNPIQAIANAISDWVSKKLSGLVDGMKEQLGFSKQAWDEYVESLSGNWENIRASAVEKWGEISSTLSQKWNEIRDGFKKTWDDIVNWLHGAWDKLETWWSGRSLPSWHISLPHISIDWQEAGELAKFFGFTRVPSLRVDWYATGGFPEDGLFMANHGELVGKFSNGRTAVANNEQIVEGIKQGVIEAILTAGNVDNGGNHTTIIDINGREFFRATYNDQKAVAKERGISLIANG